MKYYVDFDDTIVFSKEEILRILNNKFSMDRKVDEITKWNFSNLHDGIDSKMVSELFESDEFWDNVKINEYAINVLYGKDVYICSCGSDINLMKKKNFIERNFPKFKIMFTKNGYDKRNFNMSDGIQIDDVTDFLIGTNANKKILLRNNYDFEWNYIPVNSDIYVANDWYDIEKMIDWWLYCDNKRKKFSR